MKAKKFCLNEETPSGAQVDTCWHRGKYETVIFVKDSSVVVARTDSESLARKFHRNIFWALLFHTGGAFSPLTPEYRSWRKSVEDSFRRDDLFLKTCNREISQ